MVADQNTDPQMRGDRGAHEVDHCLINFRAAYIPIQTFPCDIQETDFFFFFNEPFAIFQKSRRKAC